MPSDGARSFETRICQLRNRDDGQCPMKERVWFVLNDNVSAQSFYRDLGATEDPEWRRWIMPADALNRLVEGAE